MMAASTEDRLALHRMRQMWLILAAFSAELDGNIDAEFSG
jgi:hypothetical protein